MFGIFKKKSREEKMKLHSENVFLLLISDQEEKFNFIETTEMLNDVRRKYNDYLKAKKSEKISEAMFAQNNISEIDLAIQKIS